MSASRCFYTSAFGDTARPTSTRTAITKVPTTTGTPPPPSTTAVPALPTPREARERRMQSGHDVHRIQARQVQIDQAALLIGPLCAAALVAQHPVAALVAIALLSLATTCGASLLTIGRPQPNEERRPQSPLKSMAVGGACYAPLSSPGSPSS